MEFPPYNPEQDVSNIEIDTDNSPVFTKATEGEPERHEAMAQSESWENTKRIAQGVYESAGRGFEDIYGSVGKAYDQILTTGHLYPSVDMATLTREISEDAYKQPEQGELFYLNHFHHHNPEPEQSIEPEM